MCWGRKKMSSGCEKLHCGVQRTFTVSAGTLVSWSVDGVQIIV
jgi:hypothetical protein